VDPEKGNDRSDGAGDSHDPEGLERDTAEEFDPDDPALQTEVGERLLARAAQIRREQRSTGGA